MKSTDVVALVVGAAVDRGVTVHEVGLDEVRADLLRRATVGMLSEPQWLMVRDRLVRATAREAGSSKRCELCDAPVMWVGTSNGSRMPVDPLPTVLGNVEVVQDPRSGHRRGKVLTRAELEGDPWPRFRSHFATCPRSAEVTRRPVSKRSKRSSGRPQVAAVEVRLEVLAATVAMVSRLKGVFEEHPGKVPVRVVLTQSGREVHLSCPITVEPGDPLSADLKVLAGVHSVRYVYAEESS